jgi:polysaccharide biosynthesis transport protein
MLEVARSSSSSDASGEYRFVPQLDALGLLRIVYRHWPTIVSGVGIAFLLGLLYLLFAHPRYTSTFLIYIDPRQSQSMAKQEITMNGPPDPGIIESQVEILKSDSVALRAVRRLKASKGGGGEEDEGPGLIDFILNHLPFGLAPAPPTEAEIEHAAAETLQLHQKVKRLGLTYVLEVSYWARSTEAAAAGAQAIADAYIDGEMDAKFLATQKASAWMQERIKELRDQASVAERRLLEYKAQNNIVDTGHGLMDEQQLADLNGQLGLARAATAEAKARLERIEEVSKGDYVNGSVTDALRSDIITRLRAQYLDYETKMAEFAAKYGPNHGAVQNLRAQTARIKEAIEAELHRIGETARSDYEIALARERGVQESLDKLIALQAQSSESHVQLADLESSAQTYRNIYDTFFQQFEVATKQRGFPVSDARLVTAPFPPDKPSWPKAIIIIPASLFVGTFFGLIAAIVKEFLGNNFRLADDVKNYAGFECLGILPDLALEINKRRRTGLPTPRVLGGGNAFVRHSVNAPFSRFTETLRNVKVTIDINRNQSKPVVVGIVSSVPKEGKTTFSANMALLTAKMGHPTLLIDGDLHNPSLTRTLAPDAPVGLVEVLQGAVPMDRCLRQDAESGLDFLPAIVHARDTNVIALLSSRVMAQLLEDARAAYDYIFIDLPPVAPVVDAKAFAPLVDQFVFIIEWSVTTRDVVRDALESADVLRQRVIGGVLNKADPAELKRFEAYKGRYYGSYYSDERDNDLRIG